MARGTFGERLKRERELREVSLKEITTATRISSRYLEALENEDWQRLPGGAFNRGFVKAIARYLGLDEEDLLAEYDLAIGERSSEIPRPAEGPNPPRSKWLIAGAVLAIAVIVAGLVAASIWGWRRYINHRHGAHGIVALRSPESSPQFLLSLPHRCCW
jgi:cytoskeletal protein RodZ